MAVNVPRGPSPAEDEGLRQVQAVLERYQADHPSAVVDLYRHGPYSIKVRVIDPSFAGVRRGARHQRVWSYLATLPDEQSSEVHTLLPLTPEERVESFGDYEFDHPAPLTVGVRLLAFGGQPNGEPTPANASQAP
jgi:stress-induced morphogen